MRKILFYTLIFFLIFVISTELMMDTLITGFASKGYAILLPVIPAAALFWIAVVVTLKVTVPRYLLKERYGLFVLFSLLISYIVLFCYLLIENVCCEWADVDLHVHDWTSPVLYFERLCDSTTMLMILFGLGGYSLFKEWKKETGRERKMMSTLNTYLTLVRTRLDRKRISDGLDEIEKSLDEEGEETIEAVDRLSDYLREQLYEMPPAPVIEKPSARKRGDRITSFLIDKKWRFARFLLFELMVLFSAAELFFDKPDKFELTPIVLEAILWAVIFLNLLLILNRYWLFRRYRKRKSEVRYIVEACMLIIGPVALFLIVEGIMQGERLVSKVGPATIFLIILIGATVSLVLYELGITSLFLLRYWIKTKKRTESLAAEAVRQEYLFLKKQINPHFLFNVLNNINILSYEDREEAKGMLRELRGMIEYQFVEASSPYTTTERELRFLYSYLRLAASRVDNLDFTIESIDVDPDFNIPTLLLLPVIENAVKHSNGVIGERKIFIKVTRTGKGLIFDCNNNFNPDKKRSSGPGGLGLANIKRRLNLLYGSADLLKVTKNHDTFNVSFLIPVTVN